MRPGRFHVGFLTGLFACAGLWIALVRLQTGVPMPASAWIHQMRVQKSRAAAIRKSPKLLIVSGSSALYGIRAASIEGWTGVPTVNLSLSCPLGLDYLLGVARRSASKGDVVLLALEYEHFSPVAAPRLMLLDYEFAYDPEYVRSLPMGEWTRHVFALPAARVLAGVWQKTQEPIRAEKCPSPHRINRNGDELNNRQTQQTAKDVEKLTGEGPSKALLSSGDQETLAWEALRRFTEWCRGEGILVLATYPALMESPRYRPGLLQQAHERFTARYRSLGIPVLGTVAEGIYPRSLFFDSMYHPSEAGTDRRTREVVEYLERGGWLAGMRSESREAGTADPDSASGKGVSSLAAEGKR